MGEEIEFENGQKWSSFRLSWAPDLDLDLGSGHGHYLFSSLIEYYMYTKFHRNRRNILWTDGSTDTRTYWRTDGRTDGNLPPIVLGRLPNFGSRPNNYHISRGMGVIKASGSKSDLQGHSRILAIFDRPHIRLPLVTDCKVLYCLYLALFLRHYHSHSFLKT